MDELAFFDSALTSEEILALATGSTTPLQMSSTELSWDSAALSDRPDGDALDVEHIDLTNFVDLLQPGNNVLAIQGLNASKDDPNFLLRAELLSGVSTIDPNVEGYATIATPGATNSASVVTPGPLISDVTHSAADFGIDILVTAVVNEALSPINTVDLTYRIMFGAEVTTQMLDDGAGVDLVAGDGVYSAVIPGGLAQPGEMIRYFVSADSIDNSSTRAPLFHDPQNSPEYFGTVVTDPSITTDLPVLHRFIENEAAAETGSGTRASIYYDGEFYDNVFIRIRGQTARNWPKKSYKIDFNDGNHFRFDSEFPRVDEFNLNTTYTDKSYVRAILAAEFHHDTGTPSSITFPMRVHQNGDFFSVAHFVEQLDKDFLRRVGLDDNGSLYKSTRNGLDGSATSGFEKKTRKDEDSSDLQAFINGLTLTGAALEQFLYDNVDIEAQINFMATAVILQNIDNTTKNYYIYRDTDGDGLWQMLPWDLDLVLGPDNLNTDMIVASQDTAPLHSSHPYIGTVAFPRNGRINYLFDAIITTPSTNEMYLRRLRTLMDDFLKQASTPTEQLYFENRIDELVTLLGPDVIDDKATWGGIAHFGNTDFTLQAANDRIKNEYLAPRRTHLFETHSIDSQGGSGIVSTLIPENVSGARYFVPSDNSLAVADWTNITDPANILDWGTGQTGIGYEDTPENYAALIKTVVDPRLGNDQIDPVDDNINISSTYVRIPFTIDDQAALDSIILNGLTLRMKYDDGFVAYLNGTELVRPNLTGTPGTQVSFDAAATNHSDTVAVVFQNFVISSFVTELVVGTNMLAIQGVNKDNISSDMLILPQLVEGVPIVSNVVGIPNEQVGNPTFLFGTPDNDGSEGLNEIVYNPISGNQDEEYISLINPNNTAVDISGWKLSGGVEFTFESGTVVPALGTVYVSPNVNAFRSRTTGPSSGQSLYILGGYSGHLSNFGETIELLADDDSFVTSVTTPFDPSEQQEFLRITEIMFNPSVLTQADIDAGFANNDDFEYLELMNVSSDLLSLDGVKFTSGINFAFPNGLSLASGERVVLVRDTAAFQHRNGTAATIIGQYGDNLNDLGSFKLSNGGETIKLDDFDNSTIVSISYDDKTSEGWYDEADGNGKSLVLIDANGDVSTLSDPLRWRPSLEDGGSPGTLDKLNADFDSDSKVGLKDLLHLKKNFGVGTTVEEGDLTGDTVVNAADLAAFLKNYGKVYQIEQTTVLPPSAPAAALTVTIDISTTTSTVNQEAIVDRVITTVLDDATEIQTEEQEDALPTRKSQSQRYTESVDQAHETVLLTSSTRTRATPLHRARRGHRTEASLHLKTKY